MSLLTATGACGGSSSNTATAPSSTTRCAVTLRAEAPSMDAAGGSGTLAVTVNRECAWEARADVDWIVLTSPRAGQGNATLGYQVSSNPQPVVRRGSLVVNDTRVDVTQSAAACALTIDSALGNVGHEGGSLRVRVAGLAGCPWTAASQASWIRVVSGATGDGNGEVTLEVAAAANEPRTGTVIIAGQPYTVAQDATPAPPSPPVPGCAYTVGPSTQVLPVGGGAATINIGAPSGCAWTAVSTAPWLAVSPASGAGPATLTVSGGANAANAARTGGVVVAGQTVLIVQDAAPTPPPTPPTPTPPVGDCTYTVTPPAQTVPASGGSAVVNVATSSGCGWTAITTVDWLIVVASGTGGSGTVTLSVAQNPSNASRTGSVVVAGQTVQISQEGSASTPTPSPCTYDVSPASVSVGAAAASAVLNVVTSATSCPWTAASAAPWVVPNPSSGTGAGQVAIAIAANDGTSPRNTTLTVAGRSIPVTQAGADAPPTCAFTIAPTSLAVPADGSTGQVMVTASAATCTWTAASGVPWITITGRPEGTGDGVVEYRVDRNEAASPRSGTFTVAGQVVTVTQEAAPPAPCTYQLSPTTVAAEASGGDVGTRLETAAHCGWTAASQASWIALAGPASGTGGADIRLTVAANTTPAARTGTVVIAGQTLQVTQAGLTAEVVRFSGRVSAFAGTCPIVTFRVMGEDIVVDSSTQFEGGACSSLRNGINVAGEGQRLPDGSLRATRVEIRGD